MFGIINHSLPQIDDQILPFLHLGFDLSQICINRIRQLDKNIVIIDTCKSKYHYYETDQKGKSFIPVAY